MTGVASGGIVERRKVGYVLRISEEVYADEQAKRVALEHALGELRRHAVVPVPGRDVRWEIDRVALPIPYRPWWVRLWDRVRRRSPRPAYVYDVRVWAYVLPPLVGRGDRGTESVVPVSRSGVARAWGVFSGRGV